MKSDFIIALTQLAAERNLPREVVLSAIEAALVSAYKRDSIAAGQDISVTLDPATGDVNVYTIKTVVEEVESPDQELTLEQAREIRPNAEVGETVPTGSLPHSAGRIAAQTAKQVVLQRLRDAERDLIYDEFADKEGEVYTATIQRVESKHITVELGRAEAILPPSEQAPFDRYRVGQKLKVLLQSVRQSNRGPELVVSRTDKELVRRLFEMEVPEIYNGAVEIVSIAREAGSRSKVAVWAKQEGVDAVGSCVGLRGIRIQNIVNELHGEKIDVVQWNKDPVRLIASALSPSQVLRVDVDEENQATVAIVPERQLSLAIGKEGQNARLAAKLTGWRVDIRSDIEDKSRPKPEPKAPVVPLSAQLGIAALMDAVGELSIDALEIPLRLRNLLVEAKLDTIGKLAAKGATELLEIKSVGQKSVDQLLEQLGRVEQLVPQPEVETAPEVVAEAVEVVEEAERAIEEPAADAVPAEVAEIVEIQEAQAAEAVEAPAEEIPAEAVPELEPEPEVVEPEPVPVAEIPEELLRPEPEPVPVAADSTSIQDLPDTIWSISGRDPSDAGAIRFAEDIAELNRGGTGRRRGSRRGGQSGRGRRARPNRRR
jgi:N utilization substance protein A